MAIRVGPAYPLVLVKAAAVHQGLIFGDAALTSVTRLGLDSSDVTACVVGLHSDDFVESSCSPWCESLLQDSYRCHYLCRRISVRLHLDDVYGVVVSAFARLASR